MEMGQKFNPWRLFIGIFIPNSLASYPGLSMAGKFLWGKLAQISGERGYCWPSMSQLSIELGMTKRRLVDIVEELEEKKFIRVERTRATHGGKNPNVYYFLWHEVLMEALREGGGGEIFSPGGSEGKGTRVVKESAPPPRGIDILSKKNQKKNQKEYPPGSVEMTLSTFLLDCILERKPDLKKPNLQSWAGHVDKMIRLDERDPERVKEVIEWCQKDQFWQDNILSTEKLREQFDKLELKMNKEDKDGARSDNPFAQSGVEAYRRLKKAKDRETKNDSNPSSGLPGMEACSSAAEG